MAGARGAPPLGNGWLVESVDEVVSADMVHPKSRKYFCSKLMQRGLGELASDAAHQTFQFTRPRKSRVAIGKPMRPFNGCPGSDYYK